MGIVSFIGCHVPVMPRLTVVFSVLLRPDQYYLPQCGPLTYFTLNLVYMVNRKYGNGQSVDPHGSTKWGIICDNSNLLTL